MPGALRVLVLNERDLRHPKAGGAEVHVTEIFSRLARRGYEITLVGSAFDGGPARDELEGMRVVRLGGVPLYYLRAAAYCARETRRGRFDVVVECLNKLPFYAPVYSKAPVLALCHHLLGETVFLQASWPVAAAVRSAEQLIPLLYRRAPFVAISQSTRDDLARRGVAAERVRVIHCGIGRPKLEPSAPSTRPPCIAYLGRLEPYKQVDVVLRAAAKLAPRFPQLSVLVVGRGRDQARLERIAREQGVADRTRFVGFVDDAERDRLLAGSRVCVCPSAKEGWGLTVIEANGVGTPVVASDSPGLRDSVRDGETGYLVAHADVDAFALRIGQLLADDALVDELSRQALAWSAEFDWDRSANAMAESIEAAARDRS